MKNMMITSSVAREHGVFQGKLYQVTSRSAAYRVLLGGPNHRNQRQSPMLQPVTQPQDNLWDIHHQSALLGVMRDWERRFFDTDWIGSLGHAPGLRPLRPITAMFASRSSGRF